MGLTQDNKRTDGLSIQNYKPIVTFIIIGLNVLVFFWETMSGGSEKIDVLLKCGASYAPYIFEDGQWYRIITSMFVHIGVEHIASNMICLIAVGQYVENYFGRTKYVIIYIVAGIIGNILSLMVDMKTGSFAVSAGASGAISGLIGTLIVLAIDPETRKIFPMYRVLMAIVLVMIPSREGIDVAAHIGGLLGGIAVGYTFYYYDKSKG